MKKILIISTYYFPYVGGAEVSVREIFKRLSNDYDIELITARLSLRNKKKEEIDGVRVIRTGVGIKFLDKIMFPFFAFLKAVRKEYDLLFCVLANQSAIAGNLINIFKKKPSILNIQSGDSEEYIKSKLVIFYFLYNLVYSKKYFYQVISKYLKKRCIEHGIDEEKIKIIPNGVDLRLFNQKENNLNTKLRIKDEKVIITVSRLAEKNAVDDLIKSIQYLENVKLIVVGEGEKEKELKELVNELGLGDKIVFLGKIDHEKLPEYYNIADVFVRASLSEGFGNSFVEAMACGVPIIGTKVGGIVDFIKDKETGLFVRVKDPKDIAEKIKILLKDESLRNKIIENGLKIVKEKYSWDKIAEKTKKLIEDILKNEKKSFIN